MKKKYCNVKKEYINLLFWSRHPPYFFFLLS